MTWLAWWAGAETWLAAASITAAVFGLAPPTVAWPVAVLSAAAARGTLRVIRLETAGRYRP